MRAERARTRASALVSGELVETCWRGWAHALGTWARTPGLGEREVLFQNLELKHPAPRYGWWEKGPED